MASDAFSKAAGRDLRRFGSGQSARPGHFAIFRGDDGLVAANVAGDDSCWLISAALASSRDSSSQAEQTSA